MLRALLISTLLGVASWDLASAQVPGEAEVRAQMEAAGMTPDQIEQVIAGFSGATSPSASVEVETPNPGCEDENENEICDDEEDDDDVAQCRVSYLDAVTKFSLDNFGTRLGEDPIGIALTCQAASGGGGLSNTYAINSNLEYWDTVLRHGGYLNPVLARRYERIYNCLLYTSPSPRDLSTSRMPSSA